MARTTLRLRAARIVLVVAGLLASVLVTVGVGLFGAGSASAAPPVVGDPGVLPPVALDTLDPDPVKQWGVVGVGTSYTAAKPQVWDFAEIGDRIYVAGNFTGVQRDGDDVTSQVFPQAYLAAFDRASGAWIPGFAPVLNRTVYDLEVSSDGKLLVGGEFTQVNGVARGGLVELDPTTGATIPSFAATITATNQPMVRKIVRVGTQLYIAGQFSGVVVGANNYFVWNMARINGLTGGIDGSFVPVFQGGIWDLAIDPVRDRVTAAGFFTSVSGQPGTAKVASVTRATGAYIPGLTPFEPNSTGQQDTVAVKYADNRLYVGGAQHIVQVLDATTNTRLGYSTAGIACDGFSPDACGYSAGGDFQKLEVVAGGLVIGGCHCFAATGTYAGRTLYSSFTGQRTDNRVAIAFNTSDSKVASTFVPGLQQNLYGTYALFVDSVGCYYVGGYYTRQADGDWAGGFGRFCRPVAAPTNLTASSTNSNATLSWTTPDAHIPIAYYKVYRNGVFQGDTAGLTYGFSSQTPGSTVNFTVKTVDVAGRISSAAAASVVIAGPDTQAPTVPTSPAAVADGSAVTLTWGPSSDLPSPGGSGVSGYLIHRDYAYVQFVPAGTLSWVNSGVADGPHRYEVRAVDLANNISAPAVVNVTVGTPDTQAPTVPATPAAVASGSNVTVSWGVSTDLPDPGGIGLSGYLIHRDYVYVQFVPAGTQSWIDIGVADGPHRYEVRAVDRNNNISAPAVSNVTVGTPDTQAPTVPATPAATVNGADVTVTWGASTDLPNPGGIGLSGYLIHRDYQFVQFIPAGTQSWQDFGVANGPHRYEVRAVDRNNNISAPAVVNATVGPPDTQAPTVPATPAATVAGSDVTVTWGASTDLPNPGGVGVSGYLIHRDYLFVKYVPAGTLTWTDLAVTSGPHRYEVRAVDLNNNISAPAPPVNITVP